MVNCFGFCGSLVTSASWSVQNGPAISNLVETVPVGLVVIFEMIGFPDVVAG